MVDNNDQYYICLGSSAGGLEALKSFFKAMPNNSGFTFIIVQHLPSNYKSFMNELLAQHTDMNINIIKDGMNAMPNQIYLIPSNRNLTIFHGKFFLVEYNNEININLPIDVFMQSLAKDKGNQSIGIVLSGSGRDGTLGVKSIKEVGGLVLAQSLSSSEFSEMPRSAISTGIIDYILPPEEMPNKIINFIKHPHIKSILDSSNNDNVSSDDLAKLNLIMRDYSGIDFSYYKNNTILRRLTRRLRINQLENIKDYVDFLQKSDTEKNTLQSELLIGVTSFFRDPEAFESLWTEVLPYMDYNKDFIRIWSAGCSTGEEVYSIAILFSEYLISNNIDCEVKIFATDVDSDALEVARDAFYPNNSFVNMDSELIDKYFIKFKDGYQVKDSLRKMIVFAKHNILKDPPFSNLDLLVCRNLFIYIKSKHQKRILSSFYFSLRKNGYMFLGSSESVGDLSDAFETVDGQWKIFQYIRGYKPKLTDNINHLKHRVVSVMENKLGAHYEKNNLMAEQLLSSILSEISPPSIIIDERDNIVQVINDASSFLTIQPGKFSNKFNANMDKETCLFVNNIIRRLKTETEKITFNNITLKGDSKNIYSLTGMKISIGNDNYFMISFERNGDQIESNTHVSIDMSEDVSDRIKELETELKLAEEGLQATIEELETSNEELQSSNEELIASNEEFQSTNEELQSVNEELYTVNNEYQSKIEKLTNLSNDLNNLMRNTELGALYLDDRLHIRRVTPIVTEITNIMTNDIGRSIKHIAIMDSYPNILEDIDSVASNLEPIDREIKDASNSYWLIRIRPYRTEYYAVNGIIITFINIDQLKSIQNEYNLINERLGKSLNLGNMAHWVYDIETGIMDLSSTKKRMLGYDEDDFPKNIINHNKLIHRDDIIKYEKAIDSCVSGEKEYWDIVYRIKRKDGIYSVHHNHGIVNTRDENGKPLTLLGVITDISDYLES